MKQEDFDQGKSVCHQEQDQPVQTVENEEFRRLFQLEPDLTLSTESNNVATVKIDVPPLIEINSDGELVEAEMSEELDCRNDKHRIEKPDLINHARIKDGKRKFYANSTLLVSTEINITGFQQEETSAVI